MEDSRMFMKEVAVTQKVAAMQQLAAMSADPPIVAVPGSEVVPGSEAASLRARPELDAAIPAPSRDLPRAPVDALRATAPAGPPPLAFSDSAGAAKWMKSLPLSGVGPAYDALLGQLQALVGAEGIGIRPRDRATIAELARDPVVHLHTELARRYAGKPQPADEREDEAADQAIALWQALWSQYSLCLKPLLEGDSELAGVKAKLLQRALYVGKQLIIVHGLARRVPPAALWQELHAYYRLAEMLDCTTAAVSDPLVPDAEGVSCYATYSHALLLGLADPHALSVRQIELVDHWLLLWARKVFPYARQRETEGALIVVDLEAPHGAVLAAVAPKAPSPSIRFGYTAKLATSVRGRLKRLAGGADPAGLQLGEDVSIEAAVVLLTHLDAKWHQVPEPAQGLRAKAIEIATGGPAAAYFRVAGRSFDRQDPLGRDAANPTKYLQTVGGITDFDRRKEEAERNWPWERWMGVAQWREASIRHPGGSGYKWFLDQLVVVREGAQIRLGRVGRLAVQPGGGLSLSVRLWAGDPKAWAVRLVNPNLSEEPAAPALLLSETPEEPSTLVMSPGAFNPGRIMRTDEPGTARKLRLLKIVERGADFERVAYERVDAD